MAKISGYVSELPDTGSRLSHLEEYPEGCPLTSSALRLAGATLGIRSCLYVILAFARVSTPSTLTKRLTATTFFVLIPLEACRSLCRRSYQPFHTLTMSTKHLLPATAASAAFFRAIAIASTARRCPHALRSFSSAAAAHAQNSKRELYTVPAYTPHKFPDFPMPPRNSGVPDTSIAGPSPETQTTKPPPSPPHETTASQKSTSEAPQISMSEGEAQKSRPVPLVEPKTEAGATATTTKTNTDLKAKPRRTSKLRPRKAALTITPSAVEHLRELLSRPDPQMIRVGVKNRGCSGLAYHLEYVDKPGAFDEVVEQDGVKVLIDSKALFSIIGSEMDWHEDKLSTRFVFRNPNITEQCGCGESFSTA